MEIDRMTRFFDCKVPMYSCNFSCPYCYLEHKGRIHSEKSGFNYSVDVMLKSLKPERLGGACFFNLCADGETLVQKEVVELAAGLLEQGHYVSIVTNGSISKRFNELSRLPREHLSRCLIKFSFHYLELRRLGIMDSFVNNVKLMRASGCSISVELTPYDDEIDIRDEIANFCRENFGALCHVTVTRDESLPDIPLLTKLTRDNYIYTWGVFDSPMFDFKMRVFNERRKEFCYAGLWTGYLELKSGELAPCYKSRMSQFIFDAPDEPIEFRPIGYGCLSPHCFNSHAWLTLGDIPELENVPTYADIRNRKTDDGSEWLTPACRAFLSQRLYENNPQYTDEEKLGSEKRRKIKEFREFPKRVVSRLRGYLRRAHLD